MEKKAGYRTITYRFRLYTDQMDWLRETKKIYNQILSFFYDVLSKEEEAWNIPKLKRMRYLESITIGTKEMLEEDIKYPIPYEKIPLYFRRAAINDAIRLHESLRSGLDGDARPADGFDASPMFYKGMYKDFTESTVTLKLFNGSGWKWVVCSLDTCGRELPSDEQMMSPVIVFDHGRAMFHVPVKEEVEDVRTVKERLPDTEKICAVYFPKADVIAVAVLMDKQGSFLESHFIRGGKDLIHRKNLIMKRINRNRESMGGDKSKLPADENKRLKEKIHHITDDAAHKVSRELVDYCKERDVSIIVVPKYGHNKGYIENSYAITHNYDWIGRRTINYVKYKSFGEGIVTATVSMKNVANTCSKCGAEIKKIGSEYICRNGHRGNLYFNNAMNLGKKFLDIYVE